MTSFESVDTMFMVCDSTKYSVKDVSEGIKKQVAFDPYNSILVKPPKPDFVALQLYNIDPLDMLLVINGDVVGAVVHLENNNQLNEKMEKICMIMSSNNIGLVVCAEADELLFMDADGKFDAYFQSENKEEEFVSKIHRTSFCRVDYRNLARNPHEIVTSITYKNFEEKDEGYSVVDLLKEINSSWEVCGSLTDIYNHLLCLKILFSVDKGCSKVVVGEKRKRKDPEDENDESFDLFPSLKKRKGGF